MKIRMFSKRIGLGSLLLFTGALAGQKPAPPIEPSRPAATPAPPSAEALMGEVERRFRSGSRVVRLDIRTVRKPRPGVIDMLEGEPIRLWGAFEGGARATSVLFVFTAPARLAGTGLLIRDATDAAGGDTLWYHMRTFRRFLEIPRSSLKLLVPGTCLTYEDARGFLASDRYAFRRPEKGAPPPAGRVAVAARPRDAAWERDLGFSSLRAVVDPARRVVETIEYTGINGERQKVFRAAVATPVGDLWLPSAARVEDFQNGIDSTLEYRYWPVSRLPGSLFQIEVEGKALLERLTSALAALGIPFEAAAKT